MIRIRDLRFIGFSESTPEALAASMNDWAARTGDPQAPEEGKIFHIEYSSDGATHSAIVAYTGAGE